MSFNKFKMADVSVYPPKPQESENPYIKVYRNRGLYPIAAKMMFAYDQGLYQLANVIWEFHIQQFGSQGTLCKDKKEISNILNVLMSISPLHIPYIIEGRLHEVVHARATHIQGVELRNYMPSNKDNPMIYALVLCSKKGVAPSKFQLSQVLDLMERYSLVHGLRSGLWESADRLADGIDKAAPKNHYRKWKAAENPDETAHFRRYLNSENARTILTTIIRRLKRKLDKIPEGDQDYPLPWSVCYVGWSRVYESRADQHLKHSHDNSLP